MPYLYNNALPVEPGGTGDCGYYVTIHVFRASMYQEEGNKIATIGHKPLYEQRRPASPFLCNEPGRRKLNKHNKPTEWIKTSRSVDLKETTNKQREIATYALPPSAPPSRASAPSSLLSTSSIVSSSSSPSKSSLSSPSSSPSPCSRRLMTRSHSRSRALKNPGSSGFSGLLWSQ